MNDCALCRIAAGGAREDLGILRKGSFVIHRRPEGAPVPGWLVVAPARHVEQIDALRGEELSALGPLLAEAAAALRAETPCEKVYISVFAEVVPHLHFHVIARPPGLPEGQRGPRLFLAEGQAEGAEALARRVLARLAPAASPHRALLLSALVCPGAGQLHNREYGKALVLLGLTLVATVLFLWRAAVHIVQAMGAAGPVLDLGDALGLAGEMWGRIAPAFVAFTATVAVLWAVSVYDAHRASRQR